MKIPILSSFDIHWFSLYHIFTVKYVLFTYAIQAQVLCTYRDTISRKLYQFKICQNPYLPREIWTHITPPYHTPEFFFILSFFHLKLCWESCISSKFVKIHISLGRYGLISHPHMRGSRNFHERGSNENGNFWSQMRGVQPSKNPEITFF